MTERQKETDQMNKEIEHANIGKADDAATQTAPTDTQKQNHANSMRLDTANTDPAVNLSTRTGATPSIGGTSYQRRK